MASAETIVLARVKPPTTSINQCSFLAVVGGSDGGIGGGVPVGVGFGLSIDFLFLSHTRSPEQRIWVSLGMNELARTDD